MQQFHKKALARLAAFWLGTSALSVGSAFAQVIDYPNGTNNASPIVLTNNTTQLQVLAGSATQSGDISQSGGPFGLEKIGAGTLILAGNNTYTGTTTISSGALQLGTGISAVTILGPIVDNSQLIYVAGSGQTTLSGNITGTGSLVLTGVGQALTLTGSNSYGDTIISCNCALNVGNGGTTGSLGAGNVTNNGFLLFNRSNGVTINSAISGTGSLFQHGTGTLTITVAQSYTGGTGIDPGSTLVLSGAGSLASSSGVGVAGTFDISQVTTPAGSVIRALGSSTPSSGKVLLGNQTLTISNNTGSEALYGGDIIGTGGITVAAGAQRFTGPVSYTGATTIASGATLGISNAGNISSSSGVVNNGDFNPGGTSVKSLTGSGSLSGNVIITDATGVFSGPVGNQNVLVGLTIAGGTQTLSGANTVSAVTVNSGATLAISGAGSFTTTNNTFTNNGTFDISAAASGISVQFLSGTGAVVLGGNTLTLANPASSGFTSTF